MAASDDLDHQQEAAVSYLDRGTAAVISGDVSAARVAYDKAVELLERLVEDNRAHRGCSIDLGIAYDLRGDLSRMNQHGEEALSSYTMSLRLREDLNRRWPGDDTIMRGLAVSRERIAAVALRSGRSSRSIYFNHSRVGASSTTLRGTSRPCSRRGTGRDAYRVRAGIARRVARGLSRDSSYSPDVCSAQGIESEWIEYLLLGKGRRPFEERVPLRFHV
jgi:hypothetical protein